MADVPTDGASTLREVVVVPPVPALLPEHVSLTDPVAELRAAVTAAVAGLRAAVGPNGPVGVLGSPGSAPVAAHLLDGAPHAPYDAERPPAGVTDLLVLGNGSATRTEKAPGHLDERAAAFDAALGAALAAADGAALADLDLGLAAALWAEAGPLQALGEVLRTGAPGWRAEVTYDDAPYGVQYWVVRLTRA